MPPGGLESCEGSDWRPGRAKNTSVAKMEHGGRPKMNDPEEGQFRVSYR